MKTLVDGSGRGKRTARRWRFAGVLGVIAWSGCASFRPTADDQLRSLQEVGETKIAATLQFPELAGTIAGLDARTFLQTVSIGILATTGERDYAQLQELVALIGAHDQERASEVERDLTERSVATKGSGVAVTADGYIVTAAHVVHLPRVLVMYLEYVERRPVMRSVPARIVFADPAADFAVLKCDVATPRFLELRADEIAPDTLVFSGGWWNQSGAGRVLEQRALRSHSTLRYRELRSSVPVLHGDSGSAVIDADGRLLGVTVRSRFGRFWRQAPKSDAVMPDARQLRQMIADDRAR